MPWGCYSSFIANTLQQTPPAGTSRNPRAWRATRVVRHRYRHGFIVLCHISVCVGDTSQNRETGL